MSRISMEYYYWQRVHCYYNSEIQAHAGAKYNTIDKTTEAK
jgi:hypothetical protein